jgi:tetratricopeptide (TPR) repeat protein
VASSSNYPIYKSSHHPFALPLQKYFFTLRYKILVPIIVVAIITFLLYQFTSIVPPASVKAKAAKEAKEAKPPPASSNFDTILSELYTKMKPADVKKVKDLYESLNASNANKASIYEALSSYWYNANVYEPYVHAESSLAQLANSEKKLTFVAHSVLQRLMVLNNTKYSNWLAAETQMLFKKANIINPSNDSTKVGLGATYFFNADGGNPMEGILGIKQVADADTTNIYAQYILGVGNSINGMTDKAVERFNNVLALDPKNVDALLRLGGIYTDKGDIKTAKETYKKLLPLATNKEQVAEVEKIISSLKN